MFPSISTKCERFLVTSQPSSPRHSPSWKLNRALWRDRDLQCEGCKHHLQITYYSNFAEHLTTQTGGSGANFCVTCEKETGIPVAFSQNHLRMPVFSVESVFSKTASVRLCEHSKIAPCPMSEVSIDFLNLYWKNMSLCNIAYSIPHLAQLFCMISSLGSKLWRHCWKGWAKFSGWTSNCRMAMQMQCREGLELLKFGRFNLPEPGDSFVWSNTQVYIDDFNKTWQTSFSDTQMQCWTWASFQCHVETTPYQTGQVLSSTSRIRGLHPNPNNNDDNAHHDNFDISLGY